LLQKGAKADTKTMKIAVSQGDLKSIRLLLQNGENANIKVNTGVGNDTQNLIDYLLVQHSIKPVGNNHIIYQDTETI
jgi:hypothetical protein